MIDLTRKIIKGIVTEKSLTLRDERNQYTFLVHPKLNKIEVKKAVEELFKVKVEKVRIITTRGKNRRMGWFRGRQPDRKKAIVTLKKGESIELLGGA